MGNDYVVITKDNKRLDFRNVTSVEFVNVYEENKKHEILREFIKFYTQVDTDGNGKMAELTIAIIDLEQVLLIYDKNYMKGQED